MKRVPDLMLSLGRLFFWGWLCDDLAGEDSEDGPTNHCEGFWLRLCCPQFCKVSFHDWEVRKIRHHFGKAIDMVFSVPGPWCFHASMSQGFRAHMRPSRRPFHHRWLCVCTTNRNGHDLDIPHGNPRWTEMFRQRIKVSKHR